MPVTRFIHCINLAAALLLPAICMGAEFSIKQDDQGVAVHIDGELFTRYISGGDSNKPYFWPLIGPDGVSMTRAFPMEDVEGERQDHPHHRSMYFGHQDISGFNTWHEEVSYAKAKNKAAQIAKLAQNETVKITRAEARKDHALLETTGVYKNASGEVLLTDERRFVFHVDPENGSRIIDVEFTFIGTEGGSTIGDIKDAGFSIRVAHPMSVDAGQGGRIINSAGQVDKKAWGKRTPWCDYHGTVDGKKVGIAILMHPSSYGYPAPWHVRTYGLFTSNPFGLKSVAREQGSGALKLGPGERATLKYRVILHRGDEKEADIEGAFKGYSAEESADAGKSIRALLISGGCCHDYANQNDILPEGISARANVVWTISSESKSRDWKNSAYEGKDWAEDFDVVVHNECYGGVKDDAFIEHIVEAHKNGLPSVVIHCSMHSYRNAATDAWRRMLGVTSMKHGPHSPIEVSNTLPEHPVMQGFGDVWTTEEGELYHIDKVWDNATVLAEGRRVDGDQTIHPCVWVSLYGKGKTFGTTLGHHNSTMRHDTYLDLVTRGLLWACDKLADDGTPLPGYAAISG